MKSKKPLIVMIILAVLAAGSAAAYFITRPEAAKPAGNELFERPEEYSYEQSAYSVDPCLSVKGANGEIFMPADIGGIYYTADLSGNIAFYSYANGTFTPYAGEVKTVSTSLAATYEKIPVKISYIVENGKTFGCGVFTSDMAPSVKVYSFAFVKLINKPEGYGSGYLLLADFDKSKFYKTDKIYSEIYNFTLSGSAGTYVSNNTRLIDRNGTFRQDWTMLTDDFISGLGGKKYFLSSRYYSEDERGERADIMVLSNAYRPEIAVRDILGLWFVNDANGMHFMRKTAGGFNNVILANSKETVLGSFEGDLFTDYLRDGNYIINKKSLVMTDLMTGLTKTLNGIDIEKATAFSVSPDGSRAVFACSGAENERGTKIQTLIFCTADGSAEPKIFSEPLLFAESCDFCWLDNSTVMSVRPLDALGKTAGSAAFSF